MKLKIRNIERMNEIDGHNSPSIAVSNEYDDVYSLTMIYRGRTWIVLLYRDRHPVSDLHAMSVKLSDQAAIQYCEIQRSELQSPGLTLAIIENQMNRLIEKIGI